MRHLRTLLFVWAGVLLFASCPEPGTTDRPSAVALATLSPLRPTKAAAAPKAERGGEADVSGDQSLSDLLRWLRASHRFTAPVEGQVAEPEDAGFHLSDVDALRLRDPLPFAGDFLTLDTSWADKEATDVRRVIESGERWHLVEFGAAAGLRGVEAKVRVHGRVAYLPHEIENGGPALEPSQEPIALGFKTELGEFQLGVEHRSFGKRLDRVLDVPQARKDQEGTEVWIARRLGLVQVRLVHSELSDNVDLNPTLARTTKDQTALTAQLKLPDWPVLGLTYAVGDSEREWFTPSGAVRTKDHQAFESVTGSVYYYGGGWDVSASSTYATSRDAVRADQETTSLYHDLYVTLHLTNTLTLVPALSTGVDLREPTRTQSGSGAASLMLSYEAPLRGWNAWTLSSYTASQSSDRTVDGHTVGVSGGVVRDLGKVLSGRASVSLELGYDRYVDSVSPESASRGAFGFLLFKVARF